VDSNTLLAQKLNKAWRFLYGRGFIDGFGHISARAENPNQILVAPHSLRDDSQPEDFVSVDLDGNLLDADDVKLPAELPIHLGIYRARPEVNSVAHLHSPYATSFTMTDQPLGISYFLAAVFRSGIPTHPDSRLILDTERADALAKSLGPHRAVLMKAHGIAVAGADVEEMLSWAFLLEENAKRTWISASVGEVEFLDDETDGRDRIRDARQSRPHQAHLGVVRGRGGRRRLIRFRAESLEPWAQDHRGRWS
jgi:ribulose-5-phosphate 4-epimerase/fuculose-1-phosphate aldolase